MKQNDFSWNALKERGRDGDNVITHFLSFLTRQIFSCVEREKCSGASWPVKEDHKSKLSH